MKVADLYWAAGIMEGEGYFGLRRGGRDLVAQVSMTDGDVIAKFKSIFGFGVVKERELPSGKVAYTWTTINQRETAGFFMTLLCMMGKRRSEKIIDCLKAWKEKPLPKKMWFSCKHGHELSGDNMRINRNGKYMKRTCVECSRLRSAKYRAKKNGSGIFTL